MVAESPLNPCRKEGCAEKALSFSDFCWEHSDHRAYLGSLQANLRKVSGACALNLKKAHVSDLDFSGLPIAGSSFSQAKLTSCSFVGSEMGDSDMTGAHLINCDFVGADMHHTNLTKVVVIGCSFSHADLRGSYLVEASLRDADFMGAILFDNVLWNADLAGARNIKMGNFRNPDSRKRRPSYHLSEKSAIGAHESYRNLKHYFYRNGLYEAGGWASYRGLKMECRHFLEKRDPRFVPSLMMDLLSGYTEKPNRVILSSLAIISIFATLYYAFNIPMSNVPGHPGHVTLWECLYFSFITFTTVGYGDIVPKPVPWFQLMAAAEAFSGPFMAGLYVFTLTRRYAAS